MLFGSFALPLAFNFAPLVVSELDTAGLHFFLPCFFVVGGISDGVSITSLRISDPEAFLNRLDSPKSEMVTICYKLMQTG